MLNITLVSYINTRPFIDGIMKEFSESEVKLTLVPPADCAQELQDGNCDVALVPVGAIKDFENIAILPNYCLGADGDVESVFILAHSPIQELDTILLDRHSRTSNGLAKILCKHHWNQTVDFIQPDGPNFDKIEGSTGGVVIGDKAIKIRNQFPYAYDLSGAWKSMTGLPFTFAVWAYRPEKIDQWQQSRLNEAMRKGAANVRESALHWAAFYGIDPEFAVHYLEKDMDYRFDADKHKAMRLYLQLLDNQADLPHAPISSAASRKLHST
ncbi:menaquinone biosynthesis protein [bacterium]|nr:menaquinone biosynthesis protein [bacterium]